MSDLEETCELGRDSEYCYIFNTVGWCSGCDYFDEEACDRNIQKEEAGGG